MTLSGGVAWYQAADMPASILERADVYLVLAKHSGRNQIQPK